MVEVWKTIEGFEGLYEVSNTSKIRSVDHFVKCNSGKRLIKGKELKPCDRGNGYMFVTLGKDGKQYNMSLHRAVAQAFIPNPENLPEINHKDENPANNLLDNLEWCDRTYNNNYGTRTLRASISKNKKVCQIKNNIIVKIWDSFTSINKENGWSIGNISSCCNGKRKRAYGYEWRYTDGITNLN